MKIARLLVFLLLVGSIPAKSQVEPEKLIGAYTYNFAQYTTWLNEADLKVFEIVLISSNTKIINEFKTFSKSKLIKGKPIELKVLSNIPDKVLASTQIIFISNEKSQYYIELYRLAEERNVLLITENMDDKRKVMINLVSTFENKLVFEVNRANIINHNLQIDPEILLLGGTEIDVANLYRTSQKEMEQLQIRFNNLSDSLNKLNETIAHSISQIEHQQTEIKKQATLLANQERELSIGKQKMIQQQSEFEIQGSELLIQRKQMAQQADVLEEQKIELSEQLNYISNQQTNIKQSKATLDSLLVEIADKNIILNEQSTTIDRQKEVVFFAIIIGVLSLIVLLSIVYSYLGKIKKNKLLTKQKVEIIAKNKEIESTNKSLHQALGQLKETQTQLVSSEKMASLGVLTAGIAHEINNPVNFIYTGINSLKNDYNDLLTLLDVVKKCSPETDEAFLKNKILDLKNDIDFKEILEIIPQTIEDIHIGAERAADIIRGLRNFSRIDKDTIQEFDVHEGIDSALLLLQNKFKNHIKIKKNYSQLPKIECYPGKLNQVFLNVISNAIDAIDKEGLITISTYFNEDKINIAIEDNGKGISSQDINKIFDPFFTTKNVGKGVGLGLSISFGIINDHKGSVEVKSTENVGTVFYISLPCILNN